jgi:hypothetical protein
MNKELENFWEQLKTQRDELRVRVHLAKSELSDEWEVIEKKWHVAEGKLHHLQNEAIDSTAEMKHSAKVVMEEISDAYDRIKNRLSD